MTEGRAVLHYLLRAENDKLLDDAHKNLHADYQKTDMKDMINGF